MRRGLRGGLAGLLLAALLGAPVPAEPRDFISESVVPAGDAVDTPLKFLSFLESRGHEPLFHVVVNRGWHNTKAGSYSGFATVEGAGLSGSDLTFGIFIEPDQSGAPAVVNDWSTRLLVEVIVKDTQTGLRNFWELIGEKTGARWHYRGNSLDVIADAANIHLGSKAEFGQRLRCSGCHVGGDLVMKSSSPTTIGNRSRSIRPAGAPAGRPGKHRKTRPPTTFSRRRALPRPLKTPSSKA